MIDATQLSSGDSGTSDTCSGRPPHSRVAQRERFFFFFCIFVSAAADDSLLQAITGQREPLQKL